MTDEIETPAAADASGEYTGPLTLTLHFDKPLQLHSKDPNPVMEMTISEPLVEHYMAYTDTLNRTKNEFEAGATLIAKNSGVQLALVKKMTGRDFQKAQDFFTGFTTPSQKGGDS